MKNVLFITYFWPPSGKASLHWPLFIIKHLPKHDWKPSVLTVDEDSFSHTDESLLSEIDKNIKVVKTAANEPFNLYRKFLGKKSDTPLIASETISLSNTNWKHKLAIWIRMNLFVPDARIGWTFSAVTGGKKLIESERPDAIISIGPPHSSHLIGKRLSKKFNIPHIPVLIDPWVDIVYYKDFKRSAPTLALDRYFERSTLRHAAQIIFVTQSSRDEYVKKYPWLEEKSHVLYWGYNEESFHGYIPKSVPATEILLHAGNIFDYQNPKALWATLQKEIRNGRNLKIVFIGTVSPGIRQSITEAGLSDRTEFKGFLPYHKMIEELSAASYVMVCATEKRHVPGKLFEYLRSGKPILAFGDDNKEIQRILDEINAGMIFPYTSNAQEFFDRVQNFQTNINVVRQFDRKEIAGMLAKILSRAVSR